MARDAATQQLTNALLALPSLTNAQAAEHFAKLADSDPRGVARLFVFDPQAGCGLETELQAAPPEGAREAAGAHEIPAYLPWAVLVDQQ